MEIIIFLLFLTYGLTYEWGKQGSLKKAFRAVFDV